MEKVSAIALGCLVWIPLLLWICSLFSWMITGDVDVISGLLGIVVGFLLGFVTMFPPVPGLAPVTFGAVVITIVMYPFMQIAMRGKQLKAVDAEAMERAYEALALKPDHLGAKIKLAKITAIRGYPAHAVALVESDLAYMPKHLYQEELRQLGQWREAARRLGSTPLPCVECGQSNPPGNLHCSRCGARFLLDHVRGKVMGKTAGRKILAAWIAMVAALAAIPLARSLPPMLAVAVIVGALLIATTAVVLALRGDSGVKGGTA